MQLERALTNEEMAVRKKQRAKGYVIDPRTNVRTNLKPKPQPKLEYVNPIERRIYLLKVGIRVGRQAIGYMAASVHRCSIGRSQGFLTDPLLIKQCDNWISENRKSILIIYKKLLRYEREMRRLGGKPAVWSSRKLVERIIAKEI
jgi:hypothetical protein